MEEESIYPNFIQSIALIFIAFSGAMAFVLIRRELYITEGTLVYTLIEEIAGIVIYCLPIIYTFKRTNTTFKQTTGDLKDIKHYTIPAIILIVGSKLVVLSLGFFLKYFLYGISDFYLENTIIDIAAIPFTILSTPILEEVLFRGLILKSFLKHYGTVKAILLSSVLFGLLHISATAILNAFIISIVISYIYIKTKSVWICIIAHSISNIIAIGYINYLLMHYLHFTLSTYVITGIMIAAAGIYLFNKACSKQQNEEASTEIEIRPASKGN